MGSSGQKTKGPFANICQAYKNQLCAVARPPTSPTSPQAALAPPLPVRGSGAGMHMPPAFEGGAHGVVPLGTLAYLHAGAYRVMQLCISLGLAYRIVIFIQVLTLNNIYSIG